MSTPAQSHQRIAVIGGGIAGLAAAHRLTEIAPGCRLTLFEAGPRLGGVLSTVHADGFQVEQSADNFITTIPWGLKLCERLGLTDQLVQTNPAHRRTYVVRAGRLHLLPDGFLMMAPTRLWPLAVTPVLSPLGKLRAAMEYFIPARTDPGDESMAAFARRRLGREVFDRLIEPLVAAVYAADMEKLSVEATLSRFREMEREHGSLIRAMRHQMRHRPKASAESGARYSMFVTLRDGLTGLVEALAARLPPGAVRLNSAVERIERQPAGWRVWASHLPSPDQPSVGARRGTQRVPGGEGRAIGGGGEGSAAAPAAEGGSQSASAPGEPFDALILATPSYVAARLLETTDADLARDLAGIEHSGTAIVSLGYRREQVAHPLDGMGVVIPAVERSPLLACSFSSQKYPHRAPAGHVLLRVFLGGARRPDLAEMDDAPLRALVQEHLDPLLGISGPPVYCDVAHWPRTMPQYHVGHKQLVARIGSRVAALPGLALAGNAFHGVGLPDCIHGGELAAERVCGEH